MKISELMTTNLVSVEIDERLEVVKNIFEQTHFHHMLVTDGSVLVGMLTDSDLFRHLTPTLGTRMQSHKDISIGNQPVIKVMNRDLVTIKEDQHLYQAIQIFYDKNISCLPVINEMHQAVGIITWRDIMRLLAKRAQKKRQSRQQQKHV
jgi:acetoin utilization protein AcuB